MDCRNLILRSNNSQIINFVAFILNLPIICPVVWFLSCFIRNSLISRRGFVIRSSSRHQKSYFTSSGKINKVYFHIIILNWLVNFVLNRFRKICQKELFDRWQNTQTAAQAGCRVTLKLKNIEIQQLIEQKNSPFVFAGKFSGLIKVKLSSREPTTFGVFRFALSDAINSNSVPTEPGCGENNRPNPCASLSKLGLSCSASLLSDLSELTFIIIFEFDSM